MLNIMSVTANRNLEVGMSKVLVSILKDGISSQSVKVMIFHSIQLFCFLHILQTPVSLEVFIEWLLT